MLSNVDTRYQPSYSPEYKNIRGKTVLIVGDSSGIGRATAAMLAGYGVQIFFVAQTSADLNRALASVEQEGGQWNGTVFNLYQATHMQHLIEQATHRLGKIDFLIHPLSQDEFEWDELFVREVMEYMRPGGHIVQIRLERDHFALFGPSAQEPRKLATLRRDARALGLHLTRIEPSAGDYRDLIFQVSTLDANQVAQYVFDSLLQPFDVDVLFLPGQFEQPLL